MSKAGLPQLAKDLCRDLDPLRFSPPVTHVYNPLVYAAQPQQTYLNKYGQGKKRVVFLGMNPGPWGMAQTGVPFGEISMVRDWMGISAEVDKPELENPKRPVTGFACTRSEVSGRRLWGLFSERYPRAGDFFKDHFVLNYCPLVFMEMSGRNVTPDKLPVDESRPLFQICDQHLIRSLDFLEPEWVIGVGGFAEKRLEKILPDLRAKPRLAKILHPSPASPAANRGWAEAASKQLNAAGVWSA
ncbi:MAG: uracil-DNA glycosylase family protein [Verrucomicrobiota bacterium]